MSKNINRVINTAFVFNGERNKYSCLLCVNLNNIFLVGENIFYLTLEWPKCE